jgi:anti-sigma-K factor RskA
VFGSDVAAAPADKVYKLWLVPGAGAPVPGPAFSAGEGLVIVEVTGDPSEAGTMAITFETNPDAVQPTPPIESTASTPA